MKFKAEQPTGKWVPRRMRLWEEEHREYYPMYEQAQDLERQGRLEEALSIYMRILSDYTPRGTVYYERPAIILERLGQFDRAIAICKRAIKVIEAGLFRADVEPFERRKVRLENKKQRIPNRPRETRTPN
ncbi:MAG: hypothetical protein ACM3ZU_01375 [Bacteroidota bacterium]